MISCLWLAFVGFCSKRCCLSKVNKQSTSLHLRMDESKEYLLDNRDNFSMCRESKIFLSQSWSKRMYSESEFQASSGIWTVYTTYIIAYLGVAG